MELFKKIVTLSVMLSVFALCAMDRPPVQIIARGGINQGQQERAERAPVLPSKDELEKAKKMQAFLNAAALGSLTYYGTGGNYHWREGYDAFKALFDQDPWMLTERGDDGKTFIRNIAERWYLKRSIPLVNRHHWMHEDDWEPDPKDGWYRRNTQGPTLKRVFEYILEQGRNNREFQVELDELFQYLLDREQEWKEPIQIVNRIFPGRYDAFKNADVVALPLPAGATEAQLADIERRAQQAREEEDRRHEARKNAFLVAQLFDGLGRVHYDLQLSNVYQLLREHPWLIHAYNDEDDSFIYRACSRGTYEGSPEARETYKELFAYLLYHGANPNQDARRASRPEYEHHTVAGHLRGHGGTHVAEFRVILNDFQNGGRDRLINRYPQFRPPEVPAAEPVLEEQNQEQNAQQNQQPRPAVQTQQRKRPVPFWSSNKGLATMFAASVVCGAGLAWYIKKYHLKKDEEGKPAPKRA